MPPSDELYEIEVLDGEIVAPAQAQLEPRDADGLPLRVTPPAVQAAMAAATGFVAGAATMALLRRYAQARLERAPAPPPALDPRAVPGRTYVVHVRQLG